jgi:hypothetical protein
LTHTFCVGLNFLTLSSIGLLFLTEIIPVWRIFHSVA